MKGNILHPCHTLLPYPDTCAKKILWKIFRKNIVKNSNKIIDGENVEKILAREISRV